MSPPFGWRRVYFEELVHGEYRRVEEPWDLPYNRPGDHYAALDARTAISLRPGVDGPIRIMIFQVLVEGDA